MSRSITMSSFCTVPIAGAFGCLVDAGSIPVKEG